MPGPSKCALPHWCAMECGMHVLLLLDIFAADFQYRRR